MVSDRDQPPEFLPLRGLANFVTVLLAGVVAAIAAKLALRQFGLGNVHLWHGLAEGQLNSAINIAIVGTAILFVVWFRRARINADGHGYPQRRALGWTFWGWVVPIINLWFPFQIMGDIWRAGLPPQRRRQTAWLPLLWWTCWLASGLSFGARAAAANAGPIPHIGGGTDAGSLSLLAVAGVALIAIIRTVSGGPVGSPLRPDAGAPAAWPLFES
ncbi:MAG TPA: DUF4328 domain-containing protein [Streptosporangiaceae bacterium]|nr:DUF4328 domain-containing protein [Streptosporangiaceae bacterium]